MLGKTIPHEIKNPLTMIAIFSGLAEIAGTGVLPALNATVQNTFVWYVMLFPVVLVVAFFLTLNFNYIVLYAPGDFKDERNFIDILSASYSKEADDVKLLRQYWKPNGQINSTHENELKNWLKSNGLDSRSITFFLNNDSFRNARKSAISELRINQE